MTPSRRSAIFIVLGLVILCCLFGAGGFIFTSRVFTFSKPTVAPLVFPTRPVVTASPVAAGEHPSLTPVDDFSPEAGKIVYVCQIFRSAERDQICIMDSDGTNQRRLTTDDQARHYYPSLAPDGQSVVFSSNMDGRFEIYELKLTGELMRTWQPGIAPEISPDGLSIVYTLNTGNGDTVWLMQRDGKNPRQVTANGWDPTWSPDGRRILFASDVKGLTQLMTIRLDGTDLRQVTDLPFLRGRSDWSPDGLNIVTYNGRPWERELYILSAEGRNPRQLTPSGGNSQGPAFSSDGKWVVFTAYFDKFKNVNGCEIYKIQVDGSNLTRLTNNDYCDWQPRWGP